MWYNFRMFIEGGRIGGAVPTAASAVEKRQRLLGLQQAEREGEENVRIVKDALPLLKGFLVDMHDQDLEDWINAWDTANEKYSTDGERMILQKQLQPIAASLVSYIKPAKEWKLAQQQLPN